MVESPHCSERYTSCLSIIYMYSQRDYCGVICQHIVPPGTTIPTVYYIVVLERLRKHIANKRTDIARTWILHQDNTKPHMAHFTSDFLAKHKIWVDTSAVFARPRIIKLLAVSHAKTAFVWRSLRNKYSGRRYLWEIFPLDTESLRIHENFLELGRKMGYLHYFRRLVLWKKVKCTAQVNKQLFLGVFFLFHDSMKFDRVNWNRFYMICLPRLLCFHSGWNLSCQHKTDQATLRLLVSCMLFPFAIIFVAISLFFGHPLYYIY